ncbi:MAG: hypothetical protein JNL30_19465 [Rubrivivax sp.]|nr:hypothetical protein [Rubrivivax sp.]
MNENLVAARGRCAGRETAPKRLLTAMVWLLALSALGLLAAWTPAARAQAGAEAPRGRLVDPAWLMQALKSAAAAPGATASTLVVLDAQPAPLHAAQHIAGARHVDVFAGGARPPGPAEMEQRFQALGLHPGTRIVVYDQGGDFFAPRLFYDLVLHGVPESDVYLLDGGLARWRAAGGEVTKEPTAAAARGSLRVSRVREELRTQLPEFLTASGDPRGNALLEALEPAWYYGATAWFGRGGHVPHAQMTPVPEYFNADKTFKSPAELRRMMAHLGVRPEQQVYSYCGGGFAAAVPFFALKYLADFPQVKLFPGSQLDWLRDERGLPTWTYAAPNLMRDTGWLKAWNGKLLRSTGASPLILVDVRPPEAYKAGHLPYAVNVPAELFRRHAHEPDRLAALLGPAGVNAALEAVVVSDGGLDADAGFAYWMLERLGQHRVSIFVDSLERWAELGQEVAREPTVVGPPAKPGQITIPRTTYAARARTTGLVADAPGAAGAAGAAAAAPLYPRVVVAMGAKPPAPPAASGAAAARVVHVPLKSLLQADGRPKPAHDLWSLLAKAGVPRYAELALAADDAGEAAAGHFVLRLMGFPDVKVAWP